MRVFSIFNINVLCIVVSVLHILAFICINNIYVINFFIKLNYTYKVIHVTFILLYIYMFY